MPSLSLDKRLPGAPGIALARLYASFAASLGCRAIVTKPQEPPSYSVFFLDADGRIKKSKRLKDCTDDREAIEKARGMSDGHRLELFDGCRLVTAFPAQDKA